MSCNINHFESYCFNAVMTTGFTFFKSSRHLHIERQNRVFSLSFNYHFIVSNPLSLTSYQGIGYATINLIQQEFTTAELD